MDPDETAILLAVSSGSKLFAFGNIVVLGGLRVKVQHRVVASERIYIVVQCPIV